MSVRGIRYLKDLLLFSKEANLTKEIFNLNHSFSTKTDCIAGITQNEFYVNRFSDLDLSFLLLSFELEIIRFCNNNFMGVDFEKGREFIGRVVSKLPKPPGVLVGMPLMLLLTAAACSPNSDSERVIFNPTPIPNTPASDLSCNGEPLRLCSHKTGDTNTPLYLNWSATQHPVNANLVSVRSSVEERPVTEDIGKDEGVYIGYRPGVKGVIFEPSNLDPTKTAVITGENGLLVQIIICQQNAPSCAGTPTSRVQIPK